MEKGELIYSSPNCPLRKRIMVSALYFLFLLLISGLGVWIVIYSLLNFADPKGGVAFGLLFITIGLAVSSSVATSEMYPHFRIYTDGITPVIRHLYPFSNCERIEIMIGPKNTRFYRWDQIACFERPLYKKEKYSITVHLNIFNSLGNRVSSERYIYYTNDGKEAILTLRKALLEHGIKEIPVVCPSCGQKPYAALEYCTNCHARRFGGGEDNNSSTTPATLACYSCGGALSYIEQYDRWYCYNCREYAPEG